MFLSTPPSRVATAISFFIMANILRFYPRHPRGWRRGRDLGRTPGRHVSIHATLAGGDRRRILVPLYPTTFLSTPPSRVATFPIIQAINKCYLFLSTPPSRVATMPMGCAPSARSVSIHATLAGGDYPASRTKQQDKLVSIHATLAGGDAADCLQWQAMYEFLSTPPSRVAMWWRYPPAARLTCFYPRHPRGWRPWA